MNLTEEENKKYQSILRKIEKSCAEIELLPDFWEDNYEEEFAKWKAKGDADSEEMKKFMDGC
jgi:hypothetical protein